ncbi:MAG: hypothetical protein NWF07_08015, partial [Candidatus Bathyarchaeota archaeon]|nr:hypothetical protein [Candidatus Bathyarchaeota archaeon]
TIGSPGGIMYEAGDFDVEQVVAPGESVMVPVSWVSTGAAPGVYSIILDGDLVFANGESETTHSVISEAFQLFEPVTGLLEVPAVVTESSVTGITQLSDTCYTGGALINIVWLNNTGSTLFIPEISVMFEGNGTQWGPYIQFYIDEPCFPGLRPYTYVCQLPEDMPTGDYTYSVNVNMHYPLVEINDDTYTFGIEGFWRDNFIIREPTVLDPDSSVSLRKGENGILVIGSDMVDVEGAGTLDDEYVVKKDLIDPTKTGFYDTGPKFEVPTELNFPDDLGDAFIVPWYKQKVKDSELTPEEQDFLENKINPIYTDEQLEALSEIPNMRAWAGPAEVEEFSFFFETPGMTGTVKSEWKFAWVSADQNDYLKEVPITVISPKLDLNFTAWVNGPNIFNGKPFTLDIMTENLGGIPFLPDIKLNIVGDPDAVIEVDDEDLLDLPKINVYTKSTTSIDVTVTDPTPSEDGFQINVEVTPSKLYEVQPIGIPDEMGTDFLMKVLTGEMGEDAADEESAYDELWLWTEVDYGFNLNDYSHSGLVHLGGVEKGGTFILATEEGDSTEDETGTDDTTNETPDGTTEPDTGEEGEQEEETGEESGGFSIQSIFQRIMDFFRNLFG